MGTGIAVYLLVGSALVLAACIWNCYDDFEPQRPVWIMTLLVVIFWPYFLYWVAFCDGPPGFKLFQKIWNWLGSKLGRCPAPARLY